MVTWIILLCFDSIHRDLNLKICLIEVLIACVVGHIAVHRSDLVKLPVLIHAEIHALIGEVILTEHLFDLPGLHLNLHIVPLVQTTADFLIVVVVLLDTLHHQLLLNLVLFMYWQLLELWVLFELLDHGYLLGQLLIDVCKVALFTLFPLHVFLFISSSRLRAERLEHLFIALIELVI